MQRDVQLMLRPKNAKQLVSKQPACDQLHSIWQSAISRGWLDHKSAGIVHTLLDTAGPRWLVSAVVHELLLLRHRVELNRGVDLALALFHTNICGCTLHLLTDSLPQLLLCNVQNNSGDVHQVVGDLSSISGNMQQQLMEPQLSALAKLTAYCVYAAIATSSNSSTNEVSFFLCNLFDSFNLSCYFISLELKIYFYIKRLFLKKNITLFRMQMNIPR